AGRAAGDDGRDCRSAGSRGIDRPDHRRAGTARHARPAGRTPFARKGAGRPMFKTNLSTRPVYNEPAVYFLFPMVALLVVWATLFTASRGRRYSRSDTQLATEATRNKARAADLRQQATRLRATVDPKQIEYASTEARQANDLIDRRTFSWTDLFNRFEATL